MFCLEACSSFLSCDHCYKAYILRTMLDLSWLDGKTRDDSSQDLVNRNLESAPDSEKSEIIHFSHTEGSLVLCLLASLVGLNPNP